MSERVVTQKRDLVGAFDSVRVDVLTVEIRVGESYEGLTLSGESHVLGKIKTELHDNTLLLGPADDAGFSTQLPLSVEFSIPRLKGVTVRSGARVSVTGLTEGRLELNAQSGSQVRVSGSADEVSARAESGGTVDLSDLRSRSVSSQSSSGGRIL